MPAARPRLDLFLASTLVLFLELACIRWFPAHVVFLSFFTNNVLLACFTGMSVGCLLARRRFHHIALTPVVLLVALGCGLAVERYRDLFSENVLVGDPTKPDVVFFGAETGVTGTLEFKVPVELMAGAFFLLVGAVMVGPGQELGRAFNRLADRNRAYTCNLLGSLAGIAAFAACSEAQLPPVAWFAAAAAAVAYFLLRPAPDAEPVRPLIPLAALVMAVGATVPTSFSGVGGFTVGREVRWSPYYRIDYDIPSGDIITNQSGHQKIIARGTPTQAPYDLPYLFARELGRPAYTRILVIGAGSGNDLARALYWCGPDARIDAVEIDPVIQRLGVRHHPDRPYADPRVVPHLGDGRNFLRQAEAGTYDLVVFALVDSLVLHSGYSNIRLESFLFSAESFADVKRVLKADGVAAVYNFFRQGWIMARLREVLRATFAAEPVVLVDPPYRKGAELPLDEFFEDGGAAMFFAGSKAAVDPLHEKFRTGSYWVPGRAGMSKELPGRFASAPPAERYEGDKMLADAFEARNRPHWMPLDATRLQESDGDLKPATDDWPFLYVRTPGVPGLTWRGIGLTLLLAGVPWGAFGGWKPPKSTTKLDGIGVRGSLSSTFNGSRFQRT